MLNKTLTAAALATLIGVASTGALAQEKPNVEKCYGVVKAGKNDCASAGANSCAGTSKVDGDGQAWVMVPKGLCEKLVGGAVQPKQ